MPVLCPPTPSDGIELVSRGCWWGGARKRRPPADYVNLLQAIKLACSQALRCLHCWCPELLGESRPPPKQKTGREDRPSAPGIKLFGGGGNSAGASAAAAVQPPCFHIDRPGQPLPHSETQNALGCVLLPSPPSEAGGDVWPAQAGGSAGAGWGARAALHPGPRPPEGRPQTSPGSSVDK